MSRVHVLKTWPEPFVAIIDGKKRHEIRIDDRGFAVGDVLNLKEWDPHEPSYKDDSVIKTPGSYTGRECWVKVTYLTPGGRWGLPENLCVMSIGDAEPDGSPTSLKRLAAAYGEGL